jgi:hypothetical protein
MNATRLMQLGASASVFALFLSSGLSGQVPEKRGNVPVLIVAPPPAEFEFADPVLVHAGGVPIDMGPQIGYAGPTLHDANGDGLLDLYVGSFKGKILLSMNVGKPHSPAFRTPKWLQAEGRDIEISNW